jgi:UDP-glucose 4-epimerase
LFNGVECVFHLAALADIVPSIMEPYEYLDVNVRGTICTLENMRRNSVNKIIYAASSSCYGIPQNFPTSEDAAIHPQYPYALSKYLGELCVKHWENVYKIKSICLRLFNVYGPRARTSGNYGAVMGVFMGQKKAGFPLTIVGDGKQKRDFVFVQDVAEAFYFSGVSQLESRVYNVGSGDPVTVQFLANQISENQVYIPKRPGEPDVTHADISRISRELNWIPRTSFDVGIQKTFDDSESWEDAPAWTEEQIAGVTKEWFNRLS